MRNDQLISLLQKADNQIEASIERGIASRYSASQTTEIVSISRELIARSRAHLKNMATQSAAMALPAGFARARAKRKRLGEG